MVEFTLRDSGGERVFVNPREVSSIYEYGRNPLASGVRMRDGTEYVVLGSPSEVWEKLAEKLADESDPALD